MSDRDNNEQDDQKNSRSRDVEYRVELVRRYLIRGITDSSEIKKNLEKHNPPIIVDVRSVQRYIAKAKKLTLELVKKREGLDKPLEQLVIELKQNYDEITREAWKQYYNVFGSPQSKVAALKLLKEIQEDWVEKLQKLGLVYEAPTKVQYLDKDGKPADPALINADKVELNQMFTAFFKAQHQDPMSDKSQGGPLPELS